MNRVRGVGTGEMSTVTQRLEAEWIQMDGVWYHVPCKQYSASIIKHECLVEAQDKDDKR